MEPIRDKKGGKVVEEKKNQNWMRFKETTQREREGFIGNGVLEFRERES